MAIGFLGERFRQFHLVGMAFICAGLLLFNWPRK
jgi:drug/metabolite transporter (DMT)-like permease